MVDKKQSSKCAHYMQSKFQSAAICWWFSRISVLLRAVEGQSEEAIFALMADYYELVGDIVTGGGGKVVKFIGDAVLLTFSEQAINAGVLALRTLKKQGDRFFCSRGKSAAIRSKRILVRFVAVRLELETTSILTFWPCGQYRCPATWQWNCTDAPHFQSAGSGDRPALQEA